MSCKRCDTVTRNAYSLQRPTFREVTYGDVELNCIMLKYVEIVQKKKKKTALVLKNRLWWLLSDGL